MFVHTAWFTAGILHCLFSVPLQTVALLNSMCLRESTLSMGSPPSYNSTSQKPTELWNKQVSMGGTEPTPEKWSAMKPSNESNLALHETFLLPNENPVLSPFLMMISCPLQAKDEIMDFFLTSSSCGMGHKRMFFFFWPMILGTQAFHLGQQEQISTFGADEHQGVWRCGMPGFLAALRSLPHVQLVCFSSLMQS